ncbi:MAG: TIR domain-containing protein [Candidatus Omnitrophica bacterium]|nr:TIR domain-containing protein [Candidatus Omnitrophota bacterium]
MSKKFEFDIALSFAGEDRGYVEKTAEVLKKMGFRIFYDKYELVTLWGKDLYVHLQEIYSKRARYTVMFISKYYAKKLWTSHERKSAQARAFRERNEYILPARFDKTSLPGLLPTVGYIELIGLKPKILAKIIKEKVGRIQRPEYFPSEPNRLYKLLNATSVDEKRRVFSVAESFFDSLLLMTKKERKILALAIANACPCGIPKDVHFNIEYLSRVASLSRDEIISLFSRLDCLGIESSVYKFKKSYHSLGQDRVEGLKIKFRSLIINAEPNTTYIMLAIFECLASVACPNCTLKAFEVVDFSALGSHTCFPEKIRN